MPDIEVETEPEGDLSNTLDNLWRIVVRRRWWIVAPAACTVLATIGILLRIPNEYRSDATLLVVEQQVPQRYVVPTTTTDVGDALQAMTRQVLSRPRLLGIIEEFGLYQKEKKRLAPEEVMEVMRRNIDIQPLDPSAGRKDFNAFKISFTTESPHLAQEVTSRLTSLFIEENLKTRADQATNTTNFLHEQLEVARTKLAEQEQRLREFKTQYLGELPEQQAGNLGILGGTQTQLQNSMASLSRAQEQRVYLQSLLTGYRGLSNRSLPVNGTPVSRRPMTPIETAQADLERLQSKRTELLGHYTPQYPDVLRVERDIAKTEAVLARLKANTPQTSGAGTGQESRAVAASAGDDEDPAVSQVKSQLEANRLEIENLSKDEKHLRAVLSQYQNRLNVTPIREQQLAGILRDYELTKQDYTDLLNKELQSRLATSLEKQQGGQQFRVVDPPSLPVLPSSPKRLKIALGSVAGGIALGLALAFLVNLRTRNFQTEEEISQCFEFPLVLGVPELLTPGEVRMRAWRQAAEWSVGCILALVVVISELYIYRHG